ncbi:flagellar hook assembly protein FlgD [Ekhidna sp.]
MKRLLYFILLLPGALVAQNVTFGNQTTLYLGDGTKFFFGGNTTLNGTLNNTGTIVSYGNLDFVLNQDVGNIKFNGIDDQELRGTTLDVGDFIVDKQGTLTLLTEQVVVSGALETVSGVVEAEDEEDLLVSGSFEGAGSGYVEGKLIGISQGGPVTFPMGVNGSPNYVTVSNLEAGAIVSVECKIPDQNTLLPDEEMVGLSDEVEWILKVSGEATNAQVSVNFSGVDLNNFSNGESIRANLYTPAIAIFSEADTLYHALSGSQNTVDPFSSTGIITSDESILITNEGRRLAIALIPLVDVPRLYIPKAFAPNAMLEENRIFRPYFTGLAITSVSIAIYDSFNKQIFTVGENGTDLDLSLYSWDGTLNSGLEAPEGVYYYNIRIVADSEEYSQVGTVLLAK